MLDPNTGLDLESVSEEPGAVPGDSIPPYVPTKTQIPPPAIPVPPPPRLGTPRPTLQQPANAPTPAASSPLPPSVGAVGDEPSGRARSAYTPWEAMSLGHQRGPLLRRLTSMDISALVLFGMTGCMLLAAIGVGVFALWQVLPRLV